MSFHAQIDGGEGLQQTHTSCTVPKTVMCLEGNAAAIIVYPDKITIVTLKMHRHTGVFDILLHVWTGSVIGF